MTSGAQYPRMNNRSHSVSTSDTITRDDVFTIQRWRMSHSGDVFVTVGNDAKQSVNVTPARAVLPSPPPPSPSLTAQPVRRTLPSPAPRSRETPTATAAADVAAERDSCAFRLLKCGVPSKQPRVTRLARRYKEATRQEQRQNGPAYGVCLVSSTTFAPRSA